jgi:hypothetical protein
VSELSDAETALAAVDKDLAAAIKTKKANRKKDHDALVKLNAKRDPLRIKVMELGAAERAADPNHPPAQGVSN